MMENCIFCKIAQRQAPVHIVYEDEYFVAFPDIRPKAPLHLLIIPKKHIASLQEAQESDIELLGGLLLRVRKIAQEKELRGYKLAMNVGKEGGQEIEHLHLHVLANEVHQ